MSWDYENPCVIELTAEREHIDGLNHVNNAVYVNWCEAAAWQHSTALGFSLASFQDLNCAFVIRRSEYDYLKPAILGDKIKIATWITACDRRLTTERRFQVVRCRDNEVLLRGCWKLITIDIASGRPVRMPKEFAATYGGVVAQAIAIDEQ